MDPSSSSSPSLPQSLHLAMAALLGASFMAISAFYIHRRTVDHDPPQTSFCNHRRTRTRARIRRELRR
ncbi:AMP deaminase [Trifolium repens]|nr:AMP deaminase [Trifolium repens]